ncbi:MAG: hypothetical protein ABIN94_09840 [Ferruginibacter sp.]
MLPKLLSRLFQLAFLLITVIGLTAIVAQLLERPLSDITVNNPVYSFGRPGIPVVTSKKHAPVGLADISIAYTRNTPGDSISITSEGMVNVENPEYFFTISRKDAVRSALGIKNTENRFILHQDETIEKFQLMPANRWQQAGFVFNDLIRYGCPALLFLGLAALFNNFSKRNYFTYANIAILRRTGWLLLIPQGLAVLVFYVFLAGILPADILKGTTGNTTMPAFYDVYADLNWTLIFLGLGLTMLSHIFTNGLKLQEDTASII